MPFHSIRYRQFFNPKIAIERDKFARSFGNSARQDFGNLSNQTTAAQNHPKPRDRNPQTPLMRSTLTQNYTTVRHLCQICRDTIILLPKLVIAGVHLRPHHKKETIMERGAGREKNATKQLPVSSESQSQKASGRGEKTEMRRRLKRHLRPVPQCDVA